MGLIYWSCWSSPMLFVSDWLYEEMDLRQETSNTLIDLRNRSCISLKIAPKSSLQAITERVF